MAGIKALTEICEIADKYKNRYPEGSAEYGAWSRIAELATVNDARTVPLVWANKPKRKRPGA